MKLITEDLELRGLKNTSSKKGTVYYILNCEDIHTGDPYQFYCPDSKVFPEGLKKGDKIKVSLIYNKFKNLIVTEVKKVG